jgi:hypothetical protein
MKEGNRTNQLTALFSSDHTMANGSLPFHGFRGCWIADWEGQAEILFVGDAGTGMEVFEQVSPSQAAAAICLAFRGLPVRRR